MTTTQGGDCELEVVGILDREAREFWNITIALDTNVNRKKRQTQEFIPGLCYIHITNACCLM